MSTLPDQPPLQWCLVGNIVNEHPAGEGGQEWRRGTKHFAPGAKVYCLPAQWGDGYESIVVIGRHRGSRAWVTMVIEAAWVTNWRAQVVYAPAALRRIQQATTLAGRRNWTGEDEAKQYVALLAQGGARQAVEGPQNLAVEDESVN
jgi:hypothetical protein